MKHLLSYIVEKLHLDDVPEYNHDIDTSGVKVDMQMDDEDLQKIEKLSEDLPQKPDEIKATKSGGVKLVYHIPKNNTPSGSKKNKEIHITKPERYQNKCYKITWHNGHRSLPYEYPMGDDWKKKNGEPKLKTIEDVFSALQEMWDRRF